MMIKLFVSKLFEKKNKEKVQQVVKLELSSTKVTMKAIREMDSVDDDLTKHHTFNITGNTYFPGESEQQ